MSGREANPFCRDGGVDGGQYTNYDMRYSSGYEDGKKAGIERSKIEIDELKARCEKAEKLIQDIAYSARTKGGIKELARNYSAK